MEQLIPYLTNAVVAEWAIVPIVTLQNPVENLSRKVEAIIKKRGGGASLKWDVYLQV